MLDPQAMGDLPFPSPDGQITPQEEELFRAIEEQLESNGVLARGPRGSAARLGECPEGRAREAFAMP